MYKLKKSLIHTRQKLAHLGEQALNMILPRYCAGCAAESEIFCRNCVEASYKTGAQCLICGFRNHTGKLCYKCKSGNSLGKILWSGRYDGALREAIWQFKYKKRKELARPLAEMLWKKFTEICSPMGDFIVIPIPLHFKKEHERGFNQAELLAQEFSGLSHLPLLTNALLKVKETKTQVEMENKELRVKNLEDSFQVNPKISESNLQLLTSNTLILIDDVATTGATLIHAAGALTRAGAKNIIGLVVAHGG